MKLHVYRYLYLANRGLIEAVSALGELSRERAFHRVQLRQTQAMIEEARAWMNSDLAEWIDQHETDRASRLDLERWKREKEDNEPPKAAKRGAGKPRVSKKPAKQARPSRAGKSRRA
jgi:hypothetical protein